MFVRVFVICRNLSVGVGACARAREYCEHMCARVTFSTFPTKTPPTHTQTHIQTLTNTTKKNNAGRNER